MTELLNAPNARYLLAYGGGSLLVLAGGLLWARSRGQEASVAVALTMGIENLMMLPLCLALADSAPRASQPPQPFGRALGRSLLGLSRNPLVLAITAGAAAALLELRLPLPLARTLDLLANSSSAASLFFVSGVLVGLPVRGLAGQVSVVAAGKRLLHPLAVWGLLSLLTLAGPVTATQRHSALLLAGASMLSISPIPGQRYGHQQANAAGLMVGTTAAFFSLSAWIALVKLGWL